MTHPLTNALAMRTAAAAVVYPTILDTALSADLTANILALPLEADHAALLREAVTLPEVAALIRDAKAVSFANNHGQGLQGWYEAMDKIDISLQPFLALETP